MPDLENMRPTHTEPDRTQLLMLRILESINRQSSLRSSDTQSSMHERLQSIVESISRVASTQQRLDVLLHASLRYVPAAQQGAIYLARSENHVFIVGAASPGESEVGSQIAALGGYVDAVAQLQSPVLIDDAEEEGLTAYPGCASRFRIARSVLVVPFVVGGRTIGVLSLENCEQARAFGKEELSFVSLLAKYTALAVDHARLSIDWPIRVTSGLPGPLVWQELVDKIPLGVLLVDRKHEYVWANETLCQLTGFTRQELEPAHGRVNAGFWADLGKLVQGKAGELHEFSIAQRSGTSCPAKAIFWNLSSSSFSGLDGYLIVLQDQREMQELEQKLFHLQRLSGIGAVLSSVSHELNNPLTTVIGFAELVLTRTDIPLDCREDIRTIVGHAERTVQIVRDLLSYVRLRDDEPVEININDVIRQTLDFRYRTLKQNGLQILTDLSEPLPPILGNARQFQQVILNMVNNAEQATRSVSGGGKIWIRTRQEGDCVRILLRDNGPGISPEIRPRIFEPFFTTKAPGEGTGLGLSISRQIVEQYQGRMWLENEPGPGAHFCIELPLPSNPDAALCDVSYECIDQTNAPSARILVVDDEKSISQLLLKVLAKQGHHVDAALSGSEALRKLSETTYDVLFLDLKIPDLPGQEIYARVKADCAELARRTVVLTGDTLNRDTAAFLSQEGITHILKPFQLADLRAAIKQVWPDRMQADR